MTTNLEFKKGVRLHPRHLDTCMIHAIQIVRDCAPPLQGDLLVVTSGMEGTHSRGSLHYEGRAWDIRYTGHFTPGDREGSVLASSDNELEHLVTNWVSSIIRQLSSEWDVVLKPNHIHIELDNGQG